MQIIWNKLVCFLAAALLLLASAIAIADEEEGSIRYKILDDGTAMRTAYTTYEETVVLPETRTLIKKGKAYPSG